MKKYALATTYYCYGCNTPSKEHLKERFNYDGDLEDLYINFSNTFDPWHKDHLEVGISGRRDLIYGKIYKLKEFIQEHILGKYEYICHIDYSDTKFARSFLEMMEKFEKSEQDFIISTEKNCWPPLGVCNRWVDYELPDNEFYYINSGAIISTPEIYLDYLTKMHTLCEESNIDFWDDQGVWQYYNLVVERLNADNNCTYFFSTGMLNESYFYTNENRIYTKFDTYPFLIHDNSSFSLNLISTI